VDLRWLAAALAWVEQDEAGAAAAGLDGQEAPVEAGAAPEPPTREVRAWARAQGMAVSDRGRLRPEVLAAWHEAHAPSEPRAAVDPRRGRPRAGSTRSEGE